MTSESVQLAGVEKLNELGITGVTMAQAADAFEAMLAAAIENGEVTLPRLDNCISYAARDNAGNWFNLQGSQWVRYQGPGRQPK